MRSWTRGNVWRALGFLAAIAGISTAMAFGPLLDARPVVEAPLVDLPSMTNVPPAGTTVQLR